MPETGLIVVGKATNLLTDGGLNLWGDATHLTHWAEDITGSSTINRESTEKIEGNFSCRLDVDAGNSLVAIYQLNIPLTPNKKHELIIWYMNSAEGKTTAFTCWDMGSNVWLKEDGTWNVGVYTITLPNSTVWKKYELDFYGHPDYSTYQIYIKRSEAASSLIYLDKVSIVECDEFVPKAIGTMNFDSGSVEPQADETLRGATSGSLAKVVSVTKSGGTWGGGDAEGSISLTECEGRFHDDENIDGMVGGANILTVNHPDTGVGVDLVWNGELSIDNDPPNRWSAGTGSMLITTESDGKIGNCIMVTENGEANSYGYQQLLVIAGKTYKFKCFVKAGTESTYKVRISDLTNSR